MKRDRSNQAVEEVKEEGNTDAPPPKRKKQVTVSNFFAKNKHAKEHDEENEEVEEDTSIEKGEKEDKAKEKETEETKANIPATPTTRKRKFEVKQLEDGAVIHYCPSFLSRFNATK